MLNLYLEAYLYQAKDMKKLDICLSTWGLKWVTNGNIFGLKWLYQSL